MINFAKKLDIQFSSDFIVGYPGETKSDHQDTIDLVKNVGFSFRIHLYIRRGSGTPATNINEISKKVSSQRLEELQGICLNNS